MNYEYALPCHHHAMKNHQCIAYAPFQHDTQNLHPGKFQNDGDGE